MDVECRSLQEFLSYVETNTLQGPLPILKLETTDSMGMRMHSESEEEKLRQSLGKDLGAKMRMSCDVFPVLRICLRAVLPMPLSRIDRAGASHRDVTEARYETWVSMNSNFPIGRTEEFSLWTEFQGALSEAVNRGGFKLEPQS